MDAQAVVATEAPLPAGVATADRSSLSLLAAIIRNPLTSLPAACFSARMVVTRNLGRLRLYVSDPALIHELLVRGADRTEKSEEMKRVLGRSLGEGLLTADGAAWRWQRQAQAPAFRHERLTALLPAMIAAAEATRDRWLALPPGTSVDVGHEMMQTTFAIILDTMLSGREGIDAARMERSVSTNLRATSWAFAMAILKAPRWLPFPGRLRSQAATRFMRRAVRDVAARRRARPADPRRRDDLLDMLLSAKDAETGRAMDDEAITDNLLTFILAGHETTALALAWTFALLGADPSCLAKLQAEIEAVTGGGPVEPRHIADLAYTRQVASEAMRLYPPAPMVARAIQQDMEIGGLPVPAGSVVFVPIYAVHRHASLWTRPEVFDPERFAPETIKARHRFAYLPFGAGPRICIGSGFAMMEAVAILAVLAKAVRLEPMEATLPEPVMRVTLRPSRPLRMRVVARDGSALKASHLKRA